MALANLLSPFRFYTLAGVQQVRLDGDFYKGRWKNSLERFYGPQPGRLIQEFVNCPNVPESILLFTRRYGPLRHYARAGEEFAYSLSAWREDQEQLRNLWRNIREVGLPIPGIHGAMAYESGRLVYWTYWLYSFLQMDLATCPVERLRICLRPNCAQPYFVAHHLGQRYCSQLCAGWVQKVWKKNWWDKKGNRWRKKYTKSKSRKRK